MAFFCTVSGVRIIAPGVAKSAGGTIPDHDGTESSNSAEQAARATMVAMRKSPDEIEPSPEAMKAAENSALEQLTAPPKTGGKGNK